MGLGLQSSIRFNFSINFLTTSFKAYSTLMDLIFVIDYLLVIDGECLVRNFLTVFVGSCLFWIYSSIFIISDPGAVLQCVLVSSFGV